MFGRPEANGSPYSQAQALERLAAMELEARAFYEGLFEGAVSEPVRNLAAMMIRAETRHHKRFLAYAERARRKESDADSDSARPMPADLARTMGVKLWPAKETIRKSAKLSRDLDFIRFAIRAEAQTAVLMTQVRMYLPPERRGYVSRVIEEEWNHKRKLEEHLQQHFL